MPQQPPDRLPAVVADTLVIADFSPRFGSRRGSRAEHRTEPRSEPRSDDRRPAPPSGRRPALRSSGRGAGRGSGDRPPGPYRRLFARPGARAFTAGNLLARLPMGMFGVSTVAMIAGSRGSYALAGAVTATGLVATALAGPWVARLVDRHGQARVAVPATACAVLGGLALLLCVHFGAPDWTLFTAYAATATTPSTGGMSRARWAHLLDGDTAALHTANSFEQAADELCYMLGPALAAFLCGTFFPEAGTLTATVLLMTGTLVFAAQRATEPPPRGRALTRSPLRAPGVPTLLAAFAATGVVFGALEISTLAFADAQGQGAAAGVVLGLQAAGSCVAGLLFGALKPGHGAAPAPGRETSAARRLPWCLTAMAVLMSLPLLAARVYGTLLALAPALLIAGMATAPTMVTAMTVLQHRTPEGRLNEGMSLAVTALLTGISCGSAAGGWCAEHLSAVAGFGVPVVAAWVAVGLGAGARGAGGARTGFGSTPRVIGAAEGDRCGRG
jgi:MFS family permease